VLDNQDDVINVQNVSGASKMCPAHQKCVRRHWPEFEECLVCYGMQTTQFRMIWIDHDIRGLSSDDCSGMQSALEFG
jgi:hypothetical protein